MNCAEFDEIVYHLDRHELDRPTGAVDAASATLSDAALAHAESCSRCAKLLTEVEGLNFALRSIAEHDAQQCASVRVEAALLQAFREQAATRNAHAARAGRVAGKLRAYRLYAWWAAAATAAAVALIAFALMRTGSTPSLRQPNAQPGGAVAEAPSAKAPLPIGHPVVSPEAQTRNVASSATAAESAQPQTAAEDEAAFYALPYAEDATLLDGGAVVRVALPRSALVAWGLPVPTVSGAGPIPADLLVGADGTPQAIRLVSQANE